MKKYVIIFSLLCSFAFAMSPGPQDIIITKTFDNMFTINITEYPSTGYTLALANIDSPYVHFVNNTGIPTSNSLVGAPIVSHWTFMLSSHTTLPLKTTIDFIQANPAGEKTIIPYNVTINSV